MPARKTKKTIEEINRRIKEGKVVVVTAEEMVGIVKEKGAAKAAREVDVVTTGTFAPMCSSGAFINFGHTKPRIKSSQVWLNDVQAYAGIAAVDFYIGATKPAEDDPLNRVHPGQFKYGGGHVIQDLVAGKKVRLKVQGYGTDCYPNREFEKRITLEDLPYAVLLNPRNAYQNYNCAVNLSPKTIYTYMGVLKPMAGNANYSTSGQLSPLFNDPKYRTIGLGTRIFLGGAQGYVVWPGTQHNPNVKRRNSVPLSPAATLMVMGNLKEMDPRWLVGVSLVGYGCSLAVGLGIPIPILDEEIARCTGVSDEEIFTQIMDYGHDYPSGEASASLGQVSYAELKSGSIAFKGQDVPTVPLSSYVRAKEIANITKSWIEKGKFLLTEPQVMIPQK